MKKIISKILSAIPMLSFAVHNEKKPVIGKWKYTKTWSDESCTVITLKIPKGGYARCKDTLITKSGFKIHNEMNTYEWEYENGTLKLDNKTGLAEFYFYDPGTDTLEWEANKFLFERIN